MNRALGSLLGRIAVMVVAGQAVLAILLILTTSWLMTSDAKGRAAERQESNMRVAWNVLEQYGSDFKVLNGQIAVGETVLNGFFEPVDKVKILVGAPQSSSWAIPASRPTLKGPTGAARRARR